MGSIHNLIEHLIFIVDGLMWEYAMPFVSIQHIDVCKQHVSQKSYHFKIIPILLPPLSNLQVHNRFKKSTLVIFIDKNNQ